MPSSRAICLADFSCRWYIRRICSYCSKVIISSSPIVLVVQMFTCTIADVSSLVNISLKNLQPWWPTFSLQETTIKPGRTSATQCRVILVYQQHSFSNLKPGRTSATYAVTYFQLVGFI